MSRVGSNSEVGGSLILVIDIKDEDIVSRYMKVYREKCAITSQISLQQK